jgi:hypothetical protein
VRPPLSEKNFGIYVDGVDTGEYADEGPWFGWLSTRLLTYPETLRLNCRVLPQPCRQRPVI